MKRRSIAVVLFFCMMLGGILFIGCGEKKKESGEVRTIIDATGRTVRIPKKVKSIVPLANGLRYLCYAQAQDMVVGVEKSGGHDF